MDVHVGMATAAAAVQLKLVTFKDAVPEWLRSLLDSDRFSPERHEYIARNGNVLDAATALVNFSDLASMYSYPL